MDGHYYVLTNSLECRRVIADKKNRANVVLTVPNSTCSNEKRFLESSGLAFVRYIFINIGSSGSSPSVLANIR